MEDGKDGRENSSAVVQETVSQVISNLVQKYVEKEESNANRNLERLEMAHIRLEASLETSDKWQITDTSLLRWRRKLKRVAQECDDTLHKCKQRILEDKHVEHEVQNSSLPNRIIHATKSFVSSIFNRNDNGLIRPIVQRFEWYADGASEFLRFIELGGTPHRRMPFNSITRNLLSGKELYHNIFRGNEYPLLQLWLLPKRTSEHGRETNLVFLKKDIYFGMIVQLSESTDIFGIAGPTLSNPKACPAQIETESSLLSFHLLFFPIQRWLICPIPVAPLAASQEGRRCRRDGRAGGPPPLAAPAGGKPAQEGRRPRLSRRRPLSLTPHAPLVAPAVGPQAHLAEREREVPGERALDRGEREARRIAASQGRVGVAADAGGWRVSLGPQPLTHAPIWSTPAPSPVVPFPRPSRRRSAPRRPPCLLQTAPSASAARWWCKPGRDLLSEVVHLPYYCQEVVHLPSTMDNTNNVGHEDLRFNFDDDDILLNENPAPRPSGVNSLLNKEHVQSLTGMGSSNDEDLEFHLGGSDDSSLGDGDTSSSSNSSANREHDGGGVQNDATEDGMDRLDNAAFSKMAEDAEMNSSVHEFWDIINKTFASEEEAYHFYNNYARDKGFGVRKQKVRRSKRYEGYGEVGIVRKDAYNFCSRYKRRRIEKGDAMAALGLMQRRQRKPFSPPCNLRTLSAVPHAMAIYNHCHGTPPLTIIQPDSVNGSRLNALRRSAEPRSNLAHGSYTGDPGWYASHEDVHDA
ncbi:hypothetical protein U9M48_011498 [Paspalum notatum var. saurae]|uniref:Disease resistance N-terminal domain-containing protein n=1 Tax=Paspalum notatum var. saurae TaxID=547442 RepID=A0AAQ3WHL3_PASNO